jgi:hypothetical protein
VLALVALVVGISGTAVAAGYVITSLEQIKPSVLTQLQGGPGYAVFNDKGLSTGRGDTRFHRLATLVIPGPGDYVAAAKVVGKDTGSNVLEQIECRLTAHTGSGGVDDFDYAQAAVQQGWDTTLPLEVVHAFSGRGTITLTCEQQGLEATVGQPASIGLSYHDAKIIATRLTSLTNKSVTH